MPKQTEPKFRHFFRVGFFFFFPREICINKIQYRLKKKSIKKKRKINTFSLLS